MTLIRSSLIWLLCALVSLAGAPRSPGCAPDPSGACGSVEGATRGCCCEGERAQAVVRSGCDCERPAPEQPAPVPDLQLALELEARNPEPCGFAADALRPMTDLTSSDLPPGALPGRSRQLALSIWQP